MRPDAGIEGVITNEDDLTKARALYRLAIAHNPDRVILLATARGSWRAATGRTRCRANQTLSWRPAARAALRAAIALICGSSRPAVLWCR